MDKATFDKIIGFCDSDRDFFLTDIEKNHVIRNFLDSYYKTIEEYKKEQGGAEPTPDEEHAIVTALLNPSTLSSFVISANNYYKQVKSNHENDFRKSYAKLDFWKNIWINLLSNIIYAIALMVVFVIAKDQIVTWLIQLVGMGQ